MTNKPFEVQDDAIVLNGVELQLNPQGDIIVDGDTISGGLDGVSTSTPVNPNPGEEEFILTLNTAGTEQQVKIVVHKKTPSIEGQGDDYGPAIGIGVDATGEGTHGDNAIAIGNDDVGFDQAANSIAIGYQAGWADDSGIGANAIAIGHRAAYNSAPANSITLNATGQNLDPDEAGLFIKPVRQEIYDDNIVYYNPTSGEITYAANPGVANIPNTIIGFINLVGDKPNNQDDAWFESVVVRGNYAYVLGGDYYILGSDNCSKVYKFDVRTGTLIWVKQIVAGRNAQFNVSVGSGVITLDLISSAGTGYIAGEELLFSGNSIGGNQPTNNFIITVDTVDVNGAIQTASVKPGYDAAGLTGTYTNLVPENDNARGNPACIAYDDFNDKIVIVSRYTYGDGDEIFDSYWTWANVYVMDPATGAINQTVTISDEGDIIPHSIATYNKAAGAAVVGMKFNEFREFGTLTLLQTGNGFFDILKSNLDPEHYPGAPYNSYSDFWIMGTGITSMNNIDNVNYYTGLTGTTLEGSGAAFLIISPGTGFAYVDPPTVWLGSEGTNYKVGHKIKILGTDLGGATPANDAIITVTGVGAGGSITSATITGTGGDPSGGTYSNVSGANYEVGSGFVGTVSINPETGVFENLTYSATGSNYVAGDIITIAGNNFANGTSPTHDLIVTVDSITGGGNVSNVTPSGTAQGNALRIEVNTVDFTAVGGSWSMKQNLQGEAFIWTPAWSNAIGGPSGDRFYDVCWSGDGEYLYAVGAGVYEVPYEQALVVKFNATTGAVVWGKDIKFSEAASNNRQARAVIEIPGSTDIMVAGAWYNNSTNQDEIILTRMTAAGVAVWQKTYVPTNGSDIDFELNLKTTADGIIVSFEQGTPSSNRGLAYLQINPTNGTVIRHRVLSSDGNSTYNYYNTTTANFADIFTDAAGDHIVMSGYTYVPTDNYYNALLFKLPIDDIFNIAVDEKWMLGEHTLNNFDWTVTTVTSAFDSFTPTEHIDTVTNILDGKGYTSITPAGELQNFIYDVVDDSAGYLEFGDGSRQSFATDKIPQIPAANDYYLTTQDSGKHIFFEDENGVVYIPHRNDRTFPVGFTFTIVNTTGSDCWVRSMTGSSSRARLKLAGRNINTVDVGIPDSGSGSIVTVMKIKDGYTMDNSDGLGDYPDVWIVSGPGDIYDNDI